MQSTYKPH